MAQRYMQYVDLYHTCERLYTALQWERMRNCYLLDRFEELNDFQIQVSILQEELMAKEDELNQMKSRFRFPGKAVLVQEVSDLSKSFEDAKSRNDHLLRDLDKALIALRKKDEELNELKPRIEEINDDKETVVKEKETLQGDLNEVKLRIEELETEMQTAKFTLTMKTEECSKLQLEKNNLDRRVTRLTEEKKELHDRKDQAVGHLQNKMSKLNEMQIEVTKLQSEKKQLLKENVELKRSKDEALSRLSKEAGAKLSIGNPAITDLSDDNRPTKLAEKLSEIYDNSWTDAFEELIGKDFDEPATIQILLQVFKDCYTASVEKEQEYSSNILKAVLTLPCERVTENDTEDDMISAKTRNMDENLISSNMQVEKAVTELKILLGPQAGSTLTKLQLPQVEQYLKTNFPEHGGSLFPKIMEYARQCTNLSWLMRIRDPSVYVDFSVKKGDKFDGDRYRQYTKSGDHVDFLVWPTLYLLEKGPLLAKGVVQPE